MQLKPSLAVLAKRRLLNYLITFESVLLILLTALAVQVRHVGEDLAFKSDVKEYALLVSFPAIWLCCLSLFGAWDLSILDNHIDGYRRLLRSSLMTFLTFSSASYLFKIQISRFVILFSLLGGTILHLILRWTFLRVADKQRNREKGETRWLVLDVNQESQNNLAKLAANYGATLTAVPIFSQESDFKTWVNEITFKITLGKYQTVFLTKTHTLSSQQIENLMWSVQQTDAKFVVHDDLGLATAQSEVNYFEGFEWISIGSPQINGSLRVLKRIFDLVLVVPAIILLIPLYVLIGIALKIDSRGKIFYTQKRIGLNGSIFTFPKFRSMRPGSDSIRLDILGRPDDAMLIRYQNDPRVTRFGRVLRRFSLDELPQLWCVLIGTMSLVGPRPILPEEETQLGDFHFRRQIAKPGLTGIWQVSGRKETSWEERMAFDLKYVQSWSLSLDLVLIARTFKAIISGKGSY
jgi:exopolysaccharide biosynthesis polyprenyl glycosylphosphotransferase